MTPQEMLDKLAEYQAQRDLLALQKQELIDAVLTQEIKAKLADIEAEFSQKGEAVNANITDLETAVKDAVIKGGATIKGAHLQAVYSKPRVTWDSNLLEGLMIAIPQLEKARKVGAPSVSIRRVG